MPDSVSKVTWGMYYTKDYGDNDPNRGDVKRTETRWWDFSEKGWVDLCNADEPNYKITDRDRALSLMYAHRSGTAPGSNLKVFAKVKSFTTITNKMAAERAVADFKRGLHKYIAIRLAIKPSQSAHDELVRFQDLLDGKGSNA